MASNYICAKIYAALADAVTGAQTITTANGYENGVGARVYSYPAMPPPEVLAMHYASGTPCIFIIGNPATPLQSKGEIEWDLTVEIRGVLGASATPMDGYHSLVGDTIKWLYSGTRQGWHASVRDTKIISIVPWAELTKPHAGFIMSVVIRYGTTDTAP